MPFTFPSPAQRPAPGFPLSGTLSHSVAFLSVRAATVPPQPQALRVMSRLVTCLRKSPVRRRGFFFGPGKTPPRLAGVVVLIVCSRLLFPEAGAHVKRREGSPDLSTMAGVLVWNSYRNGGFFAFRFGAEYRMPVLAPRFHLGACMKSSEGAGPGIRSEAGASFGRLSHVRVASGLGFAPHVATEATRPALRLRTGLGTAVVNSLRTLVSASTLQSPSDRPWRREACLPPALSRGVPGRQRFSSGP